MKKPLLFLMTLLALLVAACGARPTPTETAPPPATTAPRATFPPTWTPSPGAGLSETETATPEALIPSQTAPALATSSPEAGSPEVAVPTDDEAGEGGAAQAYPAPTEGGLLDEAVDPPEDTRPGQPTVEMPPPDQPQLATPAPAYPAPEDDDAGEGQVTGVTPPAGFDFAPPTATPGALETASPSPEATTPAATAPAGSTPGSTPTPDGHAYRLQAGTPILMADFAHPLESCRSVFVTGQVLDGRGVPVTRLVVTVRGRYNGQPVDLLGMTGTALLYGPGGFEIRLPGLPAGTDDALAIQILGLDAVPLTAAVPFDTSALCSRNLVVINFEANGG